VDGVANAVWIELNQIGALTEPFVAIPRERHKGPSLTGRVASDGVRRMTAHSADDFYRSERW
jgi:hypothetical protein